MRLLMCSVGKAFVPVSIFCPHFSTIHPTGDNIFNRSITKPVFVFFQGVE